MTTDRDWQEWGARHPYYGVVVDPQWRGKTLPADAKQRFFELGRADVARILESCAAKLGPVSLRKTLDFGCGVGRLLVPLAGLSEQAVGVDIAQSMLDEAARNLAERGLRNVTLVRTLADLPAHERFSFINTYIVLQHIRTDVGLGIFRDLVARLDAGGAAALHITYARGRYVRTLGERPLLARLARGLKLPLQRLRARLGLREPQMLMNDYDLNKVFFLIQHAGLEAGGFDFTDHKRAFGITIYVRRPG